MLFRSITNATITNSRLANNTIDTGKIANYAVTNTVAVSTTGDTSAIGTTETTIQTLSFTSTGGQLVIWTSASPKVNTDYNTFACRLYRDSTLVAKGLVTAQGAMANLVWLDTPSAGTYSYTLRLVRVAGGSTSVWTDRTIVITELKK